MARTAKNNTAPPTQTARAGHPDTPSQPHRFAHPFFTPVPILERKPVPLVGKRMLDYIEKTLLPIPKPKREPTMELEEIIGKEGVKEIITAEKIIFHAVGDTGHDGGKGQEAVAQVMTADYKANDPGGSPAFFLHLGDVNYYDNTDSGYHAQFYAPYTRYPGKIIAIPGNHDGELFIVRKKKTIPTGQKTTLEEFMANFCQKKTGVPPAAGTIYRQMISQPAVYWVLHTPFADIIGLYSNVAENPGFIAGEKIGQSQKLWLEKTLTAIAKARNSSKRKAIILAVHHPPIASGSFGGHSSSTEMLADIDDCCKKSSITPDLFLAAHAHNYQRCTRKIQFNNAGYEVPFIIAGIGGRGIQSVAQANEEVTGEFTYENSYVGYGFTTVTVDAERIEVYAYAVDDITLEKKE